jgi:hypothetical protein
VPITFDGKAEFAAYGLQFDEAYVAELGLAHAEIAESEGETAVGIQLGEEPGALRVGGEEFDDGFEVECVVASVHRGALRAAVGEELFSECFGDECHLVWFLSLEDPIGPVTNPPDRWGTTGTKPTYQRGKADVPQEAAADEVREASWSRASNSPVPGESRMLELPGQTKNIPVTKAAGHEGPQGAGQSTPQSRSAESGLRQDVATDEVREASRDRVPDSPSPGEGREVQVAWPTKKTPVTVIPDRGWTLKHRAVVIDSRRRLRKAEATDVTPALGWRGRCMGLIAKSGSELPKKRNSPNLGLGLGASNFSCQRIAYPGTCW